MIYIYPIGDFCNMLFHIASIYALAKDNGDELCLLNIEDKINSLINDTRGNDLTHAAKYKYIFNRISTANGHVSDVVNHPFQYTPIPYKKGHQYFGYFQSEKYFKHRRDEILELFRPDEEFHADIDKYSHLFGNISLHVRRNEYVRLYSSIHPPQTIEYYQNALSYLPEDMIVVIFSDDLKWCKENFIGERYVFINEIDYISLYLMSKMKHNIIANSTFSWWGAWLSEYEDKMVIAPKRWFGNNVPVGTNDADIIPENWIRI